MASRKRPAAPRSPQKAARPCKDCEPGSKRPAPHPGPRCATHHREFRKTSRKRAAEKRIEKVYGLTSGQYEALRAAQGFVCAICRRPSRVRRLAVDHDHVSGAVRGLLCRRCNYDLLGMYGMESLIRAARYLATGGTAPDVIGLVIVPTDAEQTNRWTEIDDE